MGADEITFDFDFLVETQAHQASGPSIEALLEAGDVDGACAAYEAGAGGSAGQLLELIAGKGPAMLDRLAKVFERARDFQAAAKAEERRDNLKKAAALYERANDFEAAAGAYRMAGDLVPAAKALARAGKSAPALELLDEVGDDGRREKAEVLARAGRLWEAAQLYRGLRDVHGEVFALKQIGLDEPHGDAAAHRLAQLMVSFGHLQQAADTLVDALKRSPAARTNRVLVRELVELLHRLGRTDDAARIEDFLTASAEPPEDAIVGQHPDDDDEESINAGDLEAMAQAEGRPDPFKSASDGGHAAVAYRTLKDIPLFAELSIVDMKDLYRVSEPRHFAANARLLVEGDVASGLYALVEGQARIEASGTPIRTVGRGAVVGEMSLVREAPVSASVIADVDVDALFISRDRFADYVYAHPEAAACIYRVFAVTLAERVASLTDARVAG